MSTVKYQETRRVYFQDNKDKFAYYAIQYRDLLKAEMVEAYGGECQRCGIKDIDTLTLDHIDDDSYVEKQLYGLNGRGGHKIYARLKASGWPKERLQLLCFNCNAKKEHQRRREAVEARWGTKEEVFDRPKRAGEGPRANNKSGFKGVFWNEQKQRWQAKITANGVGTSLGFYIEIADAARAYKVAAIEAWGKAANVPSEEEIDLLANKEGKKVMLQDLATELGLE